MNKLLKLLKEYNEIKENWFVVKDWWWEYLEYDEEKEPMWVYINSWTNASGEDAEAIMISRSYGFIQRLVENDKIDREKVKEKSDRIPLLLDKVWDIYNCGVLKSVLMLLSISDTPIDDLILYLK